MSRMANDGLTRRRVLKTAGGLVAAAGLPVGAAAGQTGTRSGPGDVTGRLARYMAAARDRELPPDVVREAKHRILDTLGAIVTGSKSSVSSA